MARKLQFNFCGIERRRYIMNEENAKKLLFSVADALDNAGVVFFLYGGTCLGAVREKKFIDIDLDIDLGFLSEDFIPRFEKIKQILTEKKIRFEVLDHRHRQEWDGTVYGFKFYGYGEHGDAVAFAKKDNNRFVPSHLDRFCIIYPREILENTKEIEFYGRKFFIPSDHERYLTLKYGDWKIPHKKFYNVSKSRIYSIGLTCGGFDLCHLGHINLLRQAKEKCEKLVVGISTDERFLSKKGRLPLLKYEDRAYLVSLTGYADVIDKLDMQGKKVLVDKYDPDILLIGNDWTPETYSGINLRQTVFLERTQGVSSTWYKEHIRR
jgi:glycerol-3-phosphate cytidylyltransferase